VETDYVPVIRFKGGEVSTQMAPFSVAASIDHRTLTERDPVSMVRGKKKFRKFIKSSRAPNHVN
jgi:hypothetical protein